MSLIRVGIINILVLIGLIITIEIGAGFGRLILGKDFMVPFVSDELSGLFLPYHHCLEMKTDVLLDHVPNNKGECNVKGGLVVGEYVQYEVSKQDKPVILTLGGSTTSGFYQHISDGDTYPKELARMAKDHYSILNGGMGGYSSLQELYKFLRDGPRITDLYAVISLNGINDVPNYHGKDDIRRSEYPFLTELQNTMNVRQMWIDQRLSGIINWSNVAWVLPNLYTLIHYVRFKDTIGSCLTRRPCLAQAPPSSDVGSVEKKKRQPESRFSVYSAAERWEVNVKRLNALVNLEGAKYYLFLQPALGLNGVQSKPLEGSEDARLFNDISDYYLHEIRSLYAELKKRCSLLSFCFDISDEVPPTGSVYNDQRHHNSEGNELLAGVIWQRLKENEGISE